jgi:acetyltransferase
VAVEADHPTHIAAVARFVRDRERPDTAEFAILVGDAYQRQGLGRRLAAALVEEARARGIRRFTATAASDNTAAHRLIASISEHLVYVPTGAGTTEVVAELAA